MLINSRQWLHPFPMRTLLHMLLWVFPKSMRHSLPPSQTGREAITYEESRTKLLNQKHQLEQIYYDDSDTKMTVYQTHLSPGGSHRGHGYHGGRNGHNQ